MDPVDLLQKRNDAMNRVRNAWQDIIKRYSTKKMQEQGDIVDLQAGLIVNDNGHLRSLAEKSDSIWAYSEQDLSTTKQRKKAFSKVKAMQQITDTDDPVKAFKTDPPLSHSNSKHLTRSKVAASDNLVLHNHDLTSSPGKPKYNMKKYGLSTRSDILNSHDIQITKDPMNLLKPLPQLDTPSKVRRLRKAMDKHIEYRPLHSLILRSSNKKVALVLKSRSGTNRPKMN